MIFYSGTQKVFKSTFIETEGITGGFGTKLLGDGRKRSTIFKYCEENDVPYEVLAVPNQIHSANIVQVHRNHEMVQSIDAADGLVTKDRSILLTILTADCVPIILADAEHQVIGISHQGWQGVLKGMAGKMVESMVALGASVKSIHAAIGPSIGACCYELYGDRKNDFMAEFAGERSKMFIERGGKTYLNLTYLNYKQLRDKGLRKEHIDFFPFCTRCDSRRFFSYQRDNPSSYGEMVSYVMLV